jgi:hypothetical protein
MVTNVAWLCDISVSTAAAVILSSREVAGSTLLIKIAVTF